MVISVTRRPGLVGVVHHEVRVGRLAVRGLSVALDLLVIRGAGPLPPQLVLPLPLPGRLLLPRAKGASLKEENEAEINLLMYNVASKVNDQAIE